MNCAYHPEVQAEAYCRTCGKALCAACKRDVKGVIYCEDCIAARVHDTMPAAAPAGMPAATVTKVPGAPNPALATLLGFIPGVGAMYNGQFAKAFIHILIFASLIWATDHASGGGEPFFGIMIAFWYFYMIFDAYKTARAKELGQTPPDPFGINSLLGFGDESPSRTQAAAPVAGEPGAPVAAAAVPPQGEEESRRYSGSAVGAIVLIAIGVLFLLDNLGWIGFGAIGRLWPLILIGIGVGLLFKPAYGCQCARCRARKLMGPAVLVTLGTLFLLDSLHVPGMWFGRTWSLLLVVIGVVLILQRNASSEGHVNYVGAPGTAIQPAPPAPPVTGRDNEVSHV